jgi:enoyl-CoA hydratase
MGHHMTTSEIATLSGYEEFAPWLLVEKRGNVHIVSINRPEALNAVTEEVHHAFATIWRVLRADDDVRAVVTTGVGKAFSAGGDMVMFGRLIEDEVARAFQIQEARTVFLEVIDFPKPLVSAVNGPAVGLGCSIALLSDLLVMGESSYLADPHVAVGLTAGDGGAAMLPLLIGMMKAKEYVLLGDRITAPIAEKLNLVTKVVADDAVLDEALALGERLAALPPQALRSSKVALNMHLSRAAHGVLEYALAEELTSFSTPEFKERVAAFRARSNAVAPQGLTNLLLLRAGRRPPIASRRARMSKASSKDRARSSARPEDHCSNAAMSALRTAPATTIGRRSVAGSTPSRSALVRTNRSVSSASPLIVSTRSGLSRTSTLSCSIRARSTSSPPRTPMAAARQEVRRSSLAGRWSTASHRTTRLRRGTARSTSRFAAKYRKNVRAEMLHARAMSSVVTLS